jgi:signal recognition particle receptor subunit beta
MPSINYADREISVKIVYYGMFQSGKRTNLQVIHRKTQLELRSEIQHIQERGWISFDLFPSFLGKFKGFTIKFHLYTVPGEIYHNTTRKLILRGVDGVVFIADSAPDKMPENLESFQNLEKNLAEYGYKRETVPIILQYNKRDLPNALPVEEINRQFNKYNLPVTEAVANKGVGVFDALKLIGKIMIDYLNKKYSRSRSASAGRLAPQSPIDSKLVAPPKNFPVLSQFQIGTSESDLDLEIERYQKEIEEKQRRMKASTPINQQNNELKNSHIVEGEMYVTSTDGDHQIKTENCPKVPVQKQQQGFLSKFFNEVPPSEAKTLNSSVKSDLDMEIERYQKEIEENQRRMRASTPIVNQQNNELKNSHIVEGEMFFTSDGDQQIKIENRPDVPVQKQQQGFLSKFFNEVPPSETKAPNSSVKSDLDLEIERYQKEIEEKQRRANNHLKEPEKISISDSPPANKTVLPSTATFKTILVLAQKALQMNQFSDADNILLDVGNITIGNSFWQGIVIGNRSICDLALGKISDAEEKCQKERSLYTDLNVSELILSNDLTRVYILYHKEQYDTALEMLEKLIKKNKDNPAAQCIKAMICFKQEKYSQAIEFFRNMETLCKLLNDNEGVAIAMVNQVTVYCKLNKITDANTTMDKLKIMVTELASTKLKAKIDQFIRTGIH